MRLLEFCRKGEAGPGSNDEETSPVYWPLPRLLQPVYNTPQRAATSDALEIADIWQLSFHHLRVGYLRRDRGASGEVQHLQCFKERAQTRRICSSEKCCGILRPYHHHRDRSTISWSSRRGCKERVFSVDDDETTRSRAPDTLCFFLKSTASPMGNGQFAFQLLSIQKVAVSLLWRAQHCAHFFHGRVVWAERGPLQWDDALDAGFRLPGF